MNAHKAVQETEEKEHAAKQQRDAAEYDAASPAATAHKAAMVAHDCCKHDTLDFFDGGASCRCTKCGCENIKGAGWIMPPPKAETLPETHHHKEVHHKEVHHHKHKEEEHHAHGKHAHHTR